MKQGRKPTVKQSIFIEENGLDPKEWFVTKDTPTFLQLVSRKDGRATKTIHKD